MKKLKKTTLTDIYASMLGSVGHSRKIGDGGQSMWLLQKSKKRTEPSTPPSRPPHPNFDICEVDISCSLAVAHTNPASPHNKQLQSID